MLNARCGQSYLLLQHLTSIYIKAPAKTINMDNHFIPEGFQTVSPYFIVENAPGFLAFLENAFDAKLVFVHKEEGRIVYARIKIGTSLIELSESKPAFPPTHFGFQLFVADCDAVYKKAVEAGAITIQAPADTPYGLRAGYVTDAWSNQWYISTQLENRYSPRFWEDSQ
jgi:PhnB protein